MMKTLQAIQVSLLCLLLAGAALAAGPGESVRLTNARIMQMLRAGTGEATIISLIRDFPDNLNDGPDALVALRRAGASSRLLLELRANAQAARRRRKDSVKTEAQVLQEEERRKAAAEEAAEQAPEEKTYGPWSIGLGYPFLALKRDLGDYAAEGRFITRNGVSALALRGYWNHYDIPPLTGYAGLEAGYVRFGSGHYSGSGAELSPFLGLMYSPNKAVGLSADVSPSLLFLPGGGTDSGFGKIGWAVNLGVFIRLPSHPHEERDEAPEAAPEEPAAPPPAAKPEAEPEPQPERRRKAAEAGIPYDRYISDAEEAVAARDYFKADKLYANLQDSLSEDDERLVYLYERRGWLAAKRTDFAAARGMYMKAAELLRSVAVNDATAVRVYAGLGNSFEKLGKDALAVRYYKRALEICADPRLRQQIQARLDRLQ